MDHSEVKHFPKVDHTPAKIEKLSEAIRLGHFMIGEKDYLLVGQCGCALGAAMWATGFRKNCTRVESGIDYLMGQFPGVPEDLMHEISLAHFMKRMTRMQCADWLESKGF